MPESQLTPTAAFVSLLTSSILGAFILRAAISTFNQYFVRGSESPKIEELPFGRAYGLVVVAGIAAIAVGFVTGVFSPESAAKPASSMALIGILASVTSIATLAGLLTVALKTPFSRAAAIAGLYLLIGLVVGGVLAAIALSVRMAMGR